MEIRITDLPPDGLKLETALPQDALNERLNEGAKSDIRFISPLQVACTVRPNSDGAELIGEVNSTYIQSCGRCIKEIERTSSVPIRLIIKPMPKADAEDGSGLDDPGILFFEGDYLNLEPTIHELIILSLSIYWSPPLEPSGRCGECGECPLEEKKKETAKVTIGDLLKKAGLN